MLSWSYCAFLSVAMKNVMTEYTLSKLKPKVLMS